MNYIIITVVLLSTVSIVDSIYVFLRYLQKPFVIYFIKLQFYKYMHRNRYEIEIIKILFAFETFEVQI